MTAPPFDGPGLIHSFLASHGEPRGDELELHMSDVNACDYATKLRIDGAPVIPTSKSSRQAFAMGHAIEHYLDNMFEPLRADGWLVTHGREVAYRGVVGHIDYDIERDGMRVVIDVTTTKSKSTDYKMGHALKSCGYALAIDAPMFAEVVLSLGFGIINDAAWYWFSTLDYAPQIETAIDRLQSLKVSPHMPDMAPPDGEEWRCRGYCDAFCPLNEKLALAEIPL